MLTIYGPAHHDQYASFISELSRKCMFACLPLVIGGDFNLIWTSNDKDNSNVNPGLMNMFNIFIDLHQLQEIRRSGSKYTWTNKQANPVTKNLDIILVSTEWEHKYPLCFAWSKNRSGYDHWPVSLTLVKIQETDKNVSSLKNNGYKNLTFWISLLGTGSRS
jgi:exonuclease III